MFVLQNCVPEGPPPLPWKVQRPGEKPLVVVPGGIPAVDSEKLSRTVVVWAWSVANDRIPNIPIPKLRRLLFNVFITLGGSSDNIAVSER